MRGQLAKMNEVSGSVTIFAGAGASKAVNAERFPTTKEFFDELLPPITDDNLFQFCLQYIRSLNDVETIDIEQVLWTLQSLFEYYENLLNPNDISGYALKHNLVDQLFRGHNTGHLLQISENMRDKIGGLIDSINQIVYDLYAYEPTIDELKSNWIQLISNFEGVGNRLDIFTTNYDAVIEAALNEVNGEATARTQRGISGNVRQTLDLSNWLGSATIATTLLTKMHGSLDWKMKDDKIHIGDPVFTGYHDKHAIIYPGFKGKSKLSFFQIFHEYLAKAISESSIIIFIGFAFRDEYINTIIRENLPLNASVYVINPDKSVNFPSTRSKPHYFHGGFDSKAINFIRNSMDRK